MRLHPTIPIRSTTVAILIANAILAFAQGATVADAPPSTFMLAVIGDRVDRLVAERAAGITARVVRISWKDFQPTQGGENVRYVADKRREFDQLHAAGFRVIADIGLQDTPAWLHQAYSDSYYIDQFNDRYAPGEVDSGDANLVFNRDLRKVAQQYLGQLFSELRRQIDFVRVGGGHWGELTYPAKRYGEHDNCYWGFDREAIRTSRTKDWRPGDPSPHDEAALFASWYLDQLADFQNWQIDIVRQSFGGPIIVLYPSWGIRPGQLKLAIKGNLSGATSAEINGEVPRGFDFARQIRRIHDANVIVSSTWLDADASGDDQPDQSRWSPIHYLAELVRTEQPSLHLYGENTGSGSSSTFAFTASQSRRFKLCGFAWFREEELGEPGLASLSDFQKISSSKN